MALKLFEFVEEFMRDTFLFKLTQHKKIGLIGKNVYFAGESDK